MDVGSTAIAMKTSPVPLLVLLALALPARADVVFLTNGGRVEGKVTDRGDEIEIEMRLGTMTVPKRRRHCPRTMTCRRLLRLMKIQRPQSIQRKLLNLLKRHRKKLRKNLQEKVWMLSRKKRIVFS